MTDVLQSDEYQKAAGWLIEDTDVLKILEDGRVFSREIPDFSDQHHLLNY